MNVMPQDIQEGFLNGTGTPGRRKADKWMIENPLSWPYGRLPMKKLAADPWDGYEATGYVLSYDNRTCPTVLDTAKHLYRECPPRYVYDTVDEMLDAGWTID